MQIKVFTDNHIRGSDSLTERVEGMVIDAVSRFSERITRLEVHLSDENSGAKSSGDDKRCVIEARLAGMSPQAAKHQSDSLEQAIAGAADKLAKLLERKIDRLDDRKGRTSFSGDSAG